MLQLYSVAERQVTYSPSVGNETVFDIAYSNSGDQVAVRAKDECVTLLNPKTGTVIKRLEKQGRNGSVCFSDEKYAIESADAVRVFDVYTNSELLHVDSRFPSHQCWRTDGGMLFAEDGGRLVFTDRGGKRLLEFRCTLGYVTDLEASLDSTKVVVVDSNNRVVIWDTASLDALARATQRTAPASATIDGRYSDLLAIHSAPEDRSVFGDTNEFGIHSISESLPDGYWIYNAPNWYVFAKSRIGMNRPPSPLPQPAVLPNGTRMLWLAFPGSICGGSFREIVGRLPRLIPEIKTASLTYNHRFAFPEPEKNIALAVLALNVGDEVDTPTILELLDKKAHLVLRDGSVLTRERAEESGLLQLDTAR